MTKQDDRNLTMELPDSGFLHDDEITRKFRSYIARSCREWPKCANKECQKDLQITFHRTNYKVKCSLVCFNDHSTTYTFGRPNPSDTSTSSSATSSVGKNYVGDWSIGSPPSSYDSWGKPNLNIQDSDLDEIFKGSGITYKLIFSGW